MLTEPERIVDLDRDFGAVTENSGKTGRIPVEEDANMNLGKSGIGILMLLAFVPAWAIAERIPLSPEGLQAEATHSITGLVKAVYGVDKPTTLYGEGTIETHYLLEIELQTVEKGEGLKPGELLYARCWRLKKGGAKADMAGPSGHSGIPRVGERIRAFVAYGSYGPTGQSDKGWAVVYPNGIEKLEKVEKPVASSLPTDLQLSTEKPAEARADVSPRTGVLDSWWLALVGWGVGVVTVLFVQALVARRSRAGTAPLG